ncbi:TetR/AcrR family transcriptional regulator [Microlunatus sp. GCM10028923]|uniref:TetR/AcrR family transcriptional regulator n=1 Tax=Microlunatus sp. GCM10028923 TaxID=3273400 RepID=UPI00360B567B
MPARTNKREQILQAAVLSFGEVGFNSSSLREIAARCGVSHPGLLHHFPSKEALLTAVLEHRDTDERRWFPRSESGLDVLRNLIKLVEHNVTVPGLIGLYVLTAAEATNPAHPAHDYFQRRYARLRRDTRRALHRIRDEGDLHAGVDVEDAATMINALVDGLQVQWLLAPAEVDMPTILRRHLQSLVTRKL